MPNVLNLNRMGRKPLFNEVKAFELLEARKMFGPGTTANNFITEMVSAGVLTKPCSSASMHRLLTGHMFPHLRVHVDGLPTLEKYDYKAVPRAPKGQVTTRRMNPDGTFAEKPMTKLRTQMLAKLVEHFDLTVTHRTVTIRKELLDEINIMFMNRLPEEVRAEVSRQLQIVAKTKAALQ